MRNINLTNIVKDASFSRELVDEDVKYDRLDDILESLESREYKFWKKKYWNKKNGGLAQDMFCVGLVAASYFYREALIMIPAVQFFAEGARYLLKKGVKDYQKDMEECASVGLDLEKSYVQSLPVLGVDVFEEQEEVSSVA